MAQLAIWALIGLAVLSAAVASFGVLIGPNVYQRLHYMGIAATVGVTAAVAAVVVQESASQEGIKAVLIGLVLLFMNPILTHATARAARVHERGKWQAGEDEHVEKDRP